MHTFKICDECGVKDLSDNLQLFPLKKKINKTKQNKKKNKKKKKNGNENVRQPTTAVFSVLLEESDLYFVQR